MEFCTVPVDFQVVTKGLINFLMKIEGITDLYIIGLIMWSSVISVIHGDQWFIRRIIDVGNLLCNICGRRFAPRKVTRRVILVGPLHLLDTMFPKFFICVGSTFLIVSSTSSLKSLTLLKINASLTGISEAISSDISIQDPQSARLLNDFDRVGVRIWVSVRINMLLNLVHSASLECERRNMNLGDHIRRPANAGYNSHHGSGANNFTTVQTNIVLIARE